MEGLGIFAYFPDWRDSCRDSRKEAVCISPSVSMHHCVARLALILYSTNILPTASLCLRVAVRAQEPQV